MPFQKTDTDITQDIFRKSDNNRILGNEAFRYDENWIPGNEAFKYFGTFQNMARQISEKHASPKHAPEKQDPPKQELPDQGTDKNKGTKDFLGKMTAEEQSIVLASHKLLRKGIPARTGREKRSGSIFPLMKWHEVLLPMNSRKAGATSRLMVTRKPEAL